MNYELVIFDCDGVLVDSESIANRIMAEEAIKLGAKITPEQAELHLSGGSMAASVAYIESLIDRNVPDDFVSIYRRRSFEAFQAELKMVEGIDKVLHSLSKPYCVASNGPRNKIEFNLGLTGLLSLFEQRIFSAYDIGTWKPDPEFYLHVARQLNTSPEHCIVIEDSKYGVRAAHGAGMKVFGYAPHLHRNDELEAEGAVVFESMHQLIGLL